MPCLLPDVGLGCSAAAFSAVSMLNTRGCGGEFQPARYSSEKIRHRFGGLFRLLYNIGFCANSFARGDALA